MTLAVPDSNATVQELYDRYSKGLRRCVDRVYADGGDADLADRFRANVSRFAAYKADYVKTTVSNILNDASIPLKQRQEMADAAVAGFDRHSEAECNTATSRCRTAKQWKEFNDPQRLRLFPNLRWIGTRSANPRQTHKLFEDKVWAKDDDFWNRNMPGQEWNCKCDLEETDDPVTDNSNVKTVPVPKGLEGNPSITGEIFTDKASYIAKSDKQRVEKFWKPIDEGFKTYYQYRDDANYENVKMNWDNGGMKATHINHKTHPNDNKKYFNDTLTGDDLEKEFMLVAFEKGHHVIFREEQDNVVDLDMILDGKVMDLASVTSEKGTYIGQMQKKNNQLKKYNEQHNGNFDSLCIYYHNPSYFSQEKIENAAHSIEANGNIRYIKTIYIMRKGNFDMLRIDL